MKDTPVALVVLGAGSAPQTESASPRSFGVVVGSFLALLFGFGVWKGQGVRLDLLLASLAVLLLAWKFPHWLTMPSKVWMALGSALNCIVSPLTLGVIFWGVVTPLAMIRRRLGHDPLSLRWDPSARSYWLQPERPSHDLKNQF